jgi:hypothetical protein
MKKKETLSKVGSWAFIVGVILALAGGVLAAFVGATAITAILIVLGIIVGFLNVTDSETKDYLLAAVSLVIVTGLGGPILGMVPLIGKYIETVFTAIMTFVIPATIVVAVKAIYGLAHD